MNHLIENQLLNTPITWTICGLIGILGVLHSLEIIHPIYLILSPSLVMREQQYWRLFTSFFYVGPISFRFVIDIQWLYIVSSHMESRYFVGKPLDYLFLLVVTFAILLILRFTSIIDIPFLSSLFTVVLTYLTCRVWGDMQVAMIGALAIPMRFLPYIYMAVNVISSDGTSEMIGYCVGHVLWYFLEVFPRITGYHLLSIQRLYNRVYATRALEA
ncbi:hypothetical protein ABL78_1388 [Leptomonas seymouri]|uniref:Derlin n=1 Tax=Leptomonas seymouri TaxID=5684 RepID=A0A0N1PDU1_LEPSE|nr:hypothetical protein ABL78_1388 [Leptomonas seymouri]|eukprot:KPI89512.1 hypothetical protein ABL78_1388 [Leptomonas seymouri]